MEEVRIRRYEEAVAYLPQRLRSAALAMEDWKKCCTEEFRLRSGRKASLLTAEGEFPLRQCAPIEPRELGQMVSDLCGGCRYSCSETLRQGYLTLRGGFRLGLCGSAVLREGECCALRDFSSLALRIPHEYKGVAEGLTEDLFSGGVFQSTLILSAPGGGKTTLLRDLIRCISAGTENRGALRVGVVDERGELAAAVNGWAQFDLGPKTDILDGAAKAQGIEMLLRVMNPQVIAVDEITAEEDALRMIRAANCGVGLLATMHAEGIPELRQKPLFEMLRREKVFSRVVLIRRSGGKREYAVEEFQ